MTNTQNEQLEIANTIIKQMGGSSRLSAMVGAKNFLALDSGVRFNFKLNTKMNRCEIELNDMDMYDIKFFKNYKITGREKTIEAMDKKITRSHTVVDSTEGVYGDTLTQIFETITGLRLSL